jgi:hypothetical protein
MMKDATTIKDVNGLNPNHIFDLDAAYSEFVAAEPRDNRGGVFHPSAIGMCGRRNVYEYLNYSTENHFEEADLEIFRIGNYVHLLVQDVMDQLKTVLEPKGIEFSFEREVSRPDLDRLYEDVGTGGTCDGRLRIYKPGEWEQRSVLEIKSIKDSLFQALNGPKDDHRQQAHLYAYRFDAPIIYYWYYNKNTSARRVYPELFQPDVFEEAIRKLATWYTMAEAGELPDREESWWGCPRCSYQHHCKPASLAKKNSKKQGKAMSRLRKTRFGGGQ